MIDPSPLTWRAEAPGIADAEITILSAVLRAPSAFVFGEAPVCV